MLLSLWERTPWTDLWQPSILLGSGAVALAYLLALTRWERAGHGQAVGWGQRGRFLAAVALVYVAAGSPLDFLGDGYLFSAHMLEHVILGWVVPPLALSGVPAEFWRRLEGTWAGRAWARLTHPLPALLVFNAWFAFLHTPLAVEAGLHSDGIHFAEHAVLVALGMVLWWPIVGQTSLSDPGKLLYLFGNVLALMPVDGLIIFSGRPLYPTYAHAPRVLPLTPLQDQQLGGILMNTAMIAIFGWYLARIFFRWARREARISLAAAPSAVPKESSDRQ